MDLKKIKTIMEWPTPRNVDKVRSFMGLSCYYRRFIRNFSRIDYPITSLQRKGKKFEWTEECAYSFEKLKHLLTNIAVLKTGDPDQEIMFCIDACKEGLGGVLVQEGWVVCYESRKLNEKEWIYVTHDIELENIIHALNMWRHYPLARRFVLMSDYSGLRYLFEQPNMKARQAR